MSGVYYWLQNKFDIEFLREEFRNSHCEGFYVPITFFRNENTRDGIKDSLRILGKKIIPYYNYVRELRPDLTPNKFLEDKDLERKKVTLDKLKTLTNYEVAKNYVNTKYSEYKEFCSFIRSINLDSSPIDQLIFESNKVNPEILEFEFPNIPPPPEDLSSKNEEINELRELCLKVNENFFHIQEHGEQFSRCFFSIPLMISDLLKKTTLLQNYQDFSLKFSNIMAWIIDFNELYANKDMINALYVFLRFFKRQGTSFVLKYPGPLAYRMQRCINSDSMGIIRLNGYPGQNINIGRHIPRTRHFFDPNSSEYLSLNSIGEKIKKNVDSTYNCPCEVCQKFRIDSYFKAKNWFLSENPEKEKNYERYIGRARATAHDKIRRIQNQFLLKHDFQNLDLHLNLNLEDFCEQFAQSKNFELWDYFYHRR